MGLFDVRGPGKPRTVEDEGIVLRGTSLAAEPPDRSTSPGPMSRGG
jgi:hypothetical protein